MILAYFGSAQGLNTIIVFCNVGQGDAAYIRVKNKVDVVIDAGPDSKILDCLGKFMPLFDRNIELAIISHPQKDHIAGFLYILKHYRISRFVTTSLKNKTEVFNNLIKRIKNDHIPLSYAKQGTRIVLPEAFIYFVWPTREFLKKNLVSGYSQLDPNNFSLIAQFQEAKYRALFTGDAPSSILDGLLYRSDLKTTILKIPHHGSKSGLTKEFLKLADPTIAVISVGKNNPYGHPSQEVLDMLKASKIQIRRTDLEGNIVFELKN